MLLTSRPVTEEDCIPAEAQFGMKCHAGHSLHTNDHPAAPSKDDNHEDDDEGGHCELCYKCDQPVDVFLSHNTFDFQCPSMTEEERRRLHGSQGDRSRQGYRS